MTTWTTLIPLDLAKLAKHGADQSTVATTGGQVLETASPYDIPGAIVVDHRDNVITIQFKYIGEEPTADGPKRGHVTLSLGKNSSRLYRIKVDDAGLKQQIAEATTLSGVNTSLPEIVRRAIGDLASTAKSNVRGNYEIALAAIDQATK